MPDSPKMRDTDSVRSPFFVGTDTPESSYNFRRYQYTLGFIRELHGDVLDCGERSLLTELIEEKFGVKIDNTEGDLDVRPIRGKYDFVLAFEIIEHLMNPLWFLMQVKGALREKGVLYLSTPVNKPKFFWRHDHFHEFDEYRLEKLLDRAGFTIVRRERKRFYRINGVRPVIRLLLKTGTIFLELRPRPEGRTLTEPNGG